MKVKHRLELLFQTDLKKLLRNESSTLQLLIDGSEGNTAAIAQSYIQQIINQYSIELLSSKLEKYQEVQLLLKLEFGIIQHLSREILLFQEF